jgi:PUA domain protein
MNPNHFFLQEDEGKAPDMFKRFTVEDHVSGHSQVKSSQQRAIRNKILEEYPDIEPYMELILPKKAPMVVAKW